MLVGTVYLLHFDRPYWGPRQHYVGFTRNLPQRLRDHREGTAGCVTTRRAFDQGIGFTLARVWRPGTLRLERQIKARGPVNYCPLCPRRSHATGRARSSPIPG
jgi:predicted GIY-YIG superfamily endonuclease